MRMHRHIQRRPAQHLLIEKHVEQGLTQAHHGK